MSAMTKGERDDLVRLVRQRERLARSAAEERSAVLLAEFEAQISAQHKFDDDEVWERLTKEAQAAVKKADADIAKRCAELGIPAQFRPGLNLAWYRRGESEAKERRDELRRVAKAEIAAIEKSARSRIAAASVQAQTEIISTGLTSQAAVAFLEKLPTVESLMPTLTYAGIVDKLKLAASKDDR